MTTLAAITPLTSLNDDDYVVVDLTTGTVLGTNLRLLDLDHVKLAGWTLEEVLSSDSLATQLATDSGTDLMAEVGRSGEMTDEELWRTYRSVAARITASDVKKIATKLRAIWPDASRLLIENHGDSQSVHVYADGSDHDLWDQIEDWTGDPEEDGYTLDQQVVDDADDLVNEMTSLLYNPDATSALEPFYGPERVRHEKYSGQILSVELMLDKMLG